MKKPTTLEVKNFHGFEVVFPEITYKAMDDGIIRYIQYTINYAFYNVGYEVIKIIKNTDL